MLKEKKTGRHHSAFKTALAVILAAVIILTVLSVIDSLFYSGCPGCERSAANSNARLVFTNTATYTTKCEFENNKYLPDGIYFGELSDKDVVYETVTGKDGEKYKRIVSAVEYNGTYDDFAVFMNEMIGSSSKHYYAVVFLYGVPEQTYYSLDKKLRKYYSKMELSYKKGTLAEDYCSREDFGGIYVGSYPDELPSTRERAEQFRLEHERNRRKELDVQAKEFLKKHIPEYIKNRGELADGIYRGEFNWGINEGNEFYPKEREATDLEDYFYTAFKKEKRDRPSGAFIFEIKNGEPVFVYWNQHSIIEWTNHVTDEELREAYKNGERVLESWGYAFSK